MKNLVTLIAVIALSAAPVLATVDITIVDNGGGSVTIGYANATEDISGVSMLVTITNGDAELAACVDASATNPPFNANIDYFTTTGGTPVLGDGCPVGDALVAGLPTFPSTTFAISTGVLMDPPGGAPAASGTIATIQLTGTGCSDVTLSADTAGRGGIVDINGAELVATFPATANICFSLPECMKATHPDYANWIDPTYANKNDCWCYERQCNGDADGKQQFGSFWVLSDDLAILAAAYGQPLAGNNVCADFDHAKQFGSFAVLSDDLAILAAGYGQATALCDMTHINFWIVP